VIRHDQDGTVVTLISNAVPPIEAAEATESTRSVTSRPPG
jgi:hypothetical protein